MRERVRYLGVALPASAVLMVVAAVAGAVAGGGAGALGAASGVAIAAASYTVTTLAVAWADSVNPRLVLPVGMGMYLTKFTLLGAMLIALGATGWAGKIPMAVGIIAGVVLWPATQIWWTVRHAHPYVPVPREATRDLG